VAGETHGGALSHEQSARAVADAVQEVPLKGATLLRQAQSFAVRYNALATAVPPAETPAEAEGESDLLRGDEIQ
jgi:hypothetical protein